MQRIPKTIHYVWVGGKPLTPLAKRCITSWREHLPEYEFKLWNEDNSPLRRHVFGTFSRKAMLKQTLAEYA